MTDSAYDEDYAERLPNLLHRQLTQAGHRSFFTGKTLLDLGMDVERISRFVREVRADVWVVATGSRDVLEWLASQEMLAIDARIRRWKAEERRKLGQVWADGCV